MAASIAAPAADPAALWTPGAAPVAPGWTPGPTPMSRQPTFSATNQKDSTGRAVVDTGVTGALKGVGEGLTDTGLNPVADVRGAARLVSDPAAAVVADAQSHLEPLASAQQAFRAGNYKDAAVNLLRYILHASPVGATVDAAAQEFANGEHAKAMGHLLGFAAGASLPALTAGGAPGPDVAAKADLLRREATDQVANQVLAPGNLKYKGLAQKIAPEILDRGLRGNRLQLQQAGDDLMADAANRIRQGTEEYGLDQRVPIDQILDGFNQKIRALQVNGQTIAGEEGRVAALQQMRDSLKQASAPRGAAGRFAPGKMTLADIRNVADRWGTQAAQEGAYRVAQTPEASKLADQAWAAREGRSLITNDLAQRIPSLASANADYHVGKALSDILDPALGRPRAVNAVTSGATGGLHTTGAIIGDAFGRGLSKIPVVGEGLGALIGAKVLPAIQQALHSPEWQLVKASRKWEVAKALEAGKPTLAAQLIQKAVAGVQGAASGATATAAQAGAMVPAAAGNTPSGSTQ